MATKPIDPQQQEYQEYLDYLDYQDYMDKAEMPSPQSMAPAAAARASDDIAKQAQAGLEGFGETATLGYLPQLQALAEPTTDALFNFLSGQNIRPQSYIEARDQNIARQKELSRQFPTTSLVGKAAGIVPTAVAAPAVSGVKGAAALGAAQGALYNPGDRPGEMELLQLEDRLKNAALGGALGGGLQSVAKGAGLAADRIQQRALGMTKVRPGVGTEALKEGVYGTKKQMQDKLAQVLSSKGEELQSAVSQIKGKVGSKEAAQAILAEAEKFKTPGGIIPESAKPFYEKAIQRASDVGARGELPALEQLALKRIVQKPGYSKFGEPLSKFEGQLAQKEALAIGDAIAKAASKEGVSKNIPELNQSLSKLLTAQTALNKPASNTKLDILLDLGLFGGGSLYGGPDAGITAALGRRAIMSPAVQSYGAKLLQSGSQGAAKQSPFLLQSLLEATRNK